MYNMYVLFQLVKTKQYCRMEWFMKKAITEMYPTLIAGETRCGKTTIARKQLDELPKDKYILNEVLLSSKSTAQQVQDTVMSKLDRRRKGVFGPAMGKQVTNILIILY